MARQNSTTEVRFASRSDAEIDHGQRDRYYVNLRTVSDLVPQAFMPESTEGQLTSESHALLKK